MIRRPARLCALLALLLLLQPALALDDAHWQTGQTALQRGLQYLRAQQNENGSWSPKPGPAITALAVRALLRDPQVKRDDPAVQKAVAYILSKVKADGGIHDGFLENYNTAICLSALALLNDRPEVAKVIKPAQDYLRQMQWDGQADPAGKPVTRDHAFYGGAGYGKHGRPDLSNTQIMLEGLHDSGLDCNDPAFQRALVFITRCQGTADNTAFGQYITPDGGFIYATSISKEHIGTPQSMGSPDQIDAGEKGQPVSNLRTYGSMTYAGFKSYLYAELARDDPRVQDAYRWICANFTVERNPGLPEPAAQQGYYYYSLTMARALDAWGESTLPSKAGKVDWANALIDALAKRQREDGSWTNDADRWMEGDPALVTAYACLALQHALR